MPFFPSVAVVFFGIWDNRKCERILLISILEQNPYIHLHHSLMHLGSHFWRWSYGCCTSFLDQPTLYGTHLVGDLIWESPNIIYRTYLRILRLQSKTKKTKKDWDMLLFSTTCLNWTSSSSSSFFLSFKKKKQKQLTVVQIHLLKSLRKTVFSDDES